MFVPIQSQLTCFHICPVYSELKDRKSYYKEKYQTTAKRLEERENVLGAKLEGRLCEND